MTILHFRKPPDFLLYYVKTRPCRCHSPQMGRGKNSPDMVAHLSEKRHKYWPVDLREIVVHGQRDMDQIIILRDSDWC